MDNRKRIQPFKGLTSDITGSKNNTTKEKTKQDSNKST